MSNVIICRVEEPEVRSRVFVQIRSPLLRFGEWLDLHREYETSGVEEYYLITPEWPMFAEGWVRQGNRLVSIPEPDMEGHVSPRLGIRFVFDGGTLTLFGPSERPLLTAADFADAANREEKLATELRELGADPNAE